MKHTQTALITGASRGLGLALARQLAQQGWNLLIDARGNQALEAARAELAQWTNVIAIAGDVTDAAHRQALIEATHTTGLLDLLVNNASILGPSPQPPLLEYPLDVLERVYRTNVIAPLALLQAAQHQLKPGACILNITSDAGVEAYEGWGGYGSSKAALEQLSHILAAEEPGWRVYWVDPGDMNTQMHQEAFPGEDISDRPLPETSVPGLLALIQGTYPSGRYAARTLSTEE
ncbi:MAG TPA: SDR family oxidoreductase [Ktedonosporobacter sp.]|nr:SDR family oxidoreductase [Ktedonosporobacter sp.]